MIISTSHKFVYCAVPKVASRALRGLLEPMADEELLSELFGASRDAYGLISFRNPISVKKKMAKLGVDPKEFFWFGFMRNPWDRTVSRFKFEQQRSDEVDDIAALSESTREYHERVRGLSWNEYLDKGLYTPQTAWLRGERRTKPFRLTGHKSFKDAVMQLRRRLGHDLAGSIQQGPSIAVDRIYRMEEMEVSLKELGERIGANLEVPPVRGATKRSRNYQNYYENADQIEKVARYYTEDILLGGYGYDGNVGESFNVDRYTGGALASQN